MKRQQSLLPLLPYVTLIGIALSVLILISPTTAPAQLWSGILDSSRAIDWSEAGVKGGIPNRTVQCGPTINPPASASTINNAIQACGANQFVQLGPGTFNISGAITFAGKRNVTLRGMGPDQTILDFSGGTCGLFGGHICLNGTSNIWGGTVNSVPSNQQKNWTSGYAKGTTKITLENTTGISAGMILVLDQCDDTSDTGGIVNSAVRTTFSNEGGPQGRHDTGDCPSQHFRSQQQFVEVMSVDSGTQVSIDPPIWMPNWRAAQDPEAWWWGGVSATAYFNGVEDLTVDGLDSGANSLIEIANAYNCWVKNVRGIGSNRGQVSFRQSARSTVSDSYFYRCRNCASTSYGMDFFSTGNNLIINNIFQHLVGSTLGPNPGGVVAYNYMLDAYFSSNPTFNFLNIFATHDSGGGMQLFEGNQTNGVVADYPHGNSPLSTFFRNHLRGRDEEAPKIRTQNEIPVEIRSWARAYNFVGNVLGLDGFHTRYECLPGSGNCPGGDRSIWTLNFGGDGVPNDNLVKSSMLRWGNYDTATDTTRWEASEIPTSPITFLNGNPVPATQNLPPSFFLSAMPSWWNTPWGSPAWPPIGPDVTGGDHPDPGLGGKAWQIPARLCYYNAPIDTVRYPGGFDRGVLRFNANACYGNTLPDTQSPQAPQNLRVQ